MWSVSYPGLGKRPHASPPRVPAGNVDDEFDNMFADPPGAAASRSRQDRDKHLAWQPEPDRSPSWADGQAVVHRGRSNAARLAGSKFRLRSRSPPLRTLNGQPSGHAGLTAGQGGECSAAIRTGAAAVHTASAGFYGPQAQHRGGGVGDGGTPANEVAGARSVAGASRRPQPSAQGRGQQQQRASSAAATSRPSAQRRDVFSHPSTQAHHTSMAFPANRNHAQHAAERNHAPHDAQFSSHRSPNRHPPPPSLSPLVGRAVAQPAGSPLQQLGLNARDAMVASPTQVTDGISPWNSIASSSILSIVVETRPQVGFSRRPVSSAPASTSNSNGPRYSSTGDYSTSDLTDATAVVHHSNDFTPDSGSGRRDTGWQDGGQDSVNMTDNSSGTSSSSNTSSTSDRMHDAPSVTPHTAVTAASRTSAATARSPAEARDLRLQRLRDLRSGPDAGGVIRRRGGSSSGGSSDLLAAMQYADSQQHGGPEQQQQQRLHVALPTSNQRQVSTQAIGMHALRRPAHSHRQEAQQQQLHVAATLSPPRVGARHSPPQHAAALPPSPGPVRSPPTVSPPRNSGPSVSPSRPGPKPSPPRMSSAAQTDPDPSTGAEALSAGTVPAPAKANPSADHTPAGRSQPGGRPHVADLIRRFREAPPLPREERRPDGVAAGRTAYTSSGTGIGAEAGDELSRHQHEAHHPASEVPAGHSPAPGDDSDGSPSSSSSSSSAGFPASPPRLGEMSPTRLAVERLTKSALQPGRTTLRDQESLVQRIQDALTRSRIGATAVSSSFAHGRAAAAAAGSVTAGQSSSRSPSSRQPPPRSPPSAQAGHVAVSESAVAAGGGPGAPDGSPTPSRSVASSSDSTWRATRASLAAATDRSGATATGGAMPCWRQKLKALLQEGASEDSGADLLEKWKRRMYPPQQDGQTAGHLPASAPYQRQQLPGHGASGTSPRSQLRQAVAGMALPATGAVLLDKPSAFPAVEVGAGIVPVGGAQQQMRAALASWMDVMSSSLTVPGGTAGQLVSAPGGTAGQLIIAPGGMARELRSASFAPDASNKMSEGPAVLKGGGEVVVLLALHAAASATAGIPHPPLPSVTQLSVVASDATPSTRSSALPPDAEAELTAMLSTLSARYGVTLSVVGTPLATRTGPSSSLPPPALPAPGTSLLGPRLPSTPQLSFTTAAPQQLVTFDEASLVSPPLPAAQPSNTGGAQTVTYGEASVVVPPPMFPHYDVAVSTSDGRLQAAASALFAADRAADGASRTTQTHQVVSPQQSLPSTSSAPSLHPPPASMQLTTPPVLPAPAYKLPSEPLHAVVSSDIIDDMAVTSTLLSTSSDSGSQLSMPSTLATVSALVSPVCGPVAESPSPLPSSITHGEPSVQSVWSEQDDVQHSVRVSAAVFASGLHDEGQQVASNINTVLGGPTSLASVPDADAADFARQDMPVADASHALSRHVDVLGDQPGDVSHQFHSEPVHSPQHAASRPHAASDSAPGPHAFSPVLSMLLREAVGGTLFGESPAGQPMGPVPGRPRDAEALDASGAAGEEEEGSFLHRRSRGSLNELAPRQLTMPVDSAASSPSSSRSSSPVPSNPHNVRLSHILEMTVAGMLFDMSPAMSADWSDAGGGGSTAGRPWRTSSGGDLRYSHSPTNASRAWPLQHNIDAGGPASLQPTVTTSVVDMQTNAGICEDGGEPDGSATTPGRAWGDHPKGRRISYDLDDSVSDFGESAAHAFGGASFAAPHSDLPPRDADEDEEEACLPSFESYDAFLGQLPTAYQVQFQPFAPSTRWAATPQCVIEELMDDEDGDAGVGGAPAHPSVQAAAARAEASTPVATSNAADSNGVAAPDASFVVHTADAALSSRLTSAQQAMPDTSSMVLNDRLGTLASSGSADVQAPEVDAPGDMLLVRTASDAADRQPDVCLDSQTGMRVAVELSFSQAPSSPHLRGDGLATDTLDLIDGGSTGVAIQFPAAPQSVVPANASGVIDSTKDADNAQRSVGDVAHPPSPNLPSSPVRLPTRTTVEADAVPSIATSAHLSHDVPLRVQLNHHGATAAASPPLAAALTAAAASAAPPPLEAPTAPAAPPPAAAPTALAPPPQAPASAPVRLGSLTGDTLRHKSTGAPDGTAGFDSIPAAPRALPAAAAASAQGVMSLPAAADRPVPSVGTSQPQQLAELVSSVARDDRWPSGVPLACASNGRHSPPTGVASASLASPSRPIEGSATMVEQLPPQRGDVVVQLLKSKIQTCLEQLRDWETRLGQQGPADARRV